MSDRISGGFQLNRTERHCVTPSNLLESRVTSLDLYLVSKLRMCNNGGLVTLWASRRKSRKRSNLSSYGTVFGYVRYLGLFRFGPLRTESSWKSI